MKRRTLAALAAAALATALAFWLDPWIWRRITFPSVYEHDWGRLLRVTGSLYFWLAVTLAVSLERRRKTWLLLVAPAVGGGVAELLKLLVRRERPDLHAGLSFYRSFAERPFDSHDLGFPSSHVMVAFAGAAAVARLYPRAGAVAYLLALGCALTRVLAQAHFASDVVAGAVGGWAIGALLSQKSAAISAASR